jgi:hypothetical protein
MLRDDLTRREKRLLGQMASGPIVIRNSDLASLQDLTALGLVEKTGGVHRLTLRGQMAAAEHERGWFSRIVFLFG